MLTVITQDKKEIYAGYFKIIKNDLKYSIEAYDFSLRKRVIIATYSFYNLIMSVYLDLIHQEKCVIYKGGSYYNIYEMLDDVEEEKV